MVSNDSLQRFLFENSPVRGEIIQLTETYQAITEQHDYPPLIKELLGEALCVAGLLAAIIKFNGRLSVQFRGSGPLKFLLAQCDTQFNMRGLVKWENDLIKADLIEALSEGTLAILLDSENHQKRYQGIVPWTGGSVAEAVEGYFYNSEQLASKIWVAVGEKTATGLLLQIIPDKDKALQLAQEGEDVNPEWDRLVNIGSSLNLRDMLELNHEDLLTKIYPEEEIRIFPKVAVKFSCTCSRERGENAISVLGREEAEAELKDKQIIVVTCEFCNSEYTYDKVDVAKIFLGGQPPSDTNIH